ncbi:MAG: flotillin family protein [Solirubrobacterales bacterium]
MDIVIGIAVVAFIAFWALVFTYLLYRRAWKIPKPDEALIIVGRAKGGRAPVKPDDIDADVVEAISERRTEGLDFRISTSATWVNPVTSRTYRLPLDSRSASFEVDCHDNQKVAVNVKGVILFKVGDNYPAMAAAARRFLNMKEDRLNESIRDLVTGQVRALVGGMTTPELITDRQSLIDNVRDATHDEMARLGLAIDSLTIQEVSDPNSYIQNLGRPQAEAVAQAASIAADEARQAKEAAKQDADLDVARVRRDTEVKAADYQAEQDEASERAAQAGPLSRARAEREVVVEQTKVAELEAEMAEKRYDAEIRKRADADAYRVEKEAEAQKARLVAEAEAEGERRRQIGDASAHATRVQGEAEADAIERRELAEAAGLREKGKALIDNGRLVIEQQIAGDIPQIARAFAEPLGAIKNLTVLDGAEGLSRSVVGSIVAAGGALENIRDLMGNGGGSDGSDPDGSQPAELGGDSGDSGTGATSASGGRSSKSNGRSDTTDRASQAGSSSSRRAPTPRPPSGSASARPSPNPATASTGAAAAAAPAGAAAADRVELHHDDAPPEPVGEPDAEDYRDHDRTAETGVGHLRALLSEHSDADLRELVQIIRTDERARTAMADLATDQRRIDALLDSLPLDQARRNRLARRVRSMTDLVSS